MLDQNDLKQIEEVVERIVESKNFSTKEDLKNLENRMDTKFTTKEDLKNLENRMDSRFEKIDSRFEKIDSRFEEMELKMAEQMEYMGRMLHSFREDIKEDMKQIMRTSSEDLTAVNNDVRKNKKHINVLEINVKALQMKGV
ncbi:MAG: hypothetical protein V1655_03925 [bacterium]